MDGSLEAKASQSDAPAPLYASRVKVYPAAVHGPVRRAKWAILIVCLALYYLVPWLRWDRGPGLPNQAVLVDLQGMRLYFFGIEIWAQEFYIVTFLLVLSAIGLFAVTSLFGRVWCGFTCPQTVWTDLFMWVERLIQGDRNARMRLDRAPWTSEKYLKKGATHAAWLLIGAATGGAWVMYYNDAPTVVRELATGQASTSVYFFFGLFTLTTYGLAGWAREQVCTYMCPWPRFQAAMFDDHTMIVSYRPWRGEPRGRHKAGASWDGHGDCIDCRQCVNVCPTGIDIRDGVQMECIGCGLCVDACNTIMDKVERPHGLIAFETLANLDASTAAVAAIPAGPARFEPAMKARSGINLLRGRTLVYAAALLLVTGVILGAMALRTTMDLSVQRDRAPLFVRLSDGSVRNAYTVKLLDRRQSPGTVVLEVAGLPGAHLSVIGAETDAQGRPLLSTRADGIVTWRALVTVPDDAAPHGSKDIDFRILDPSGRRLTAHESAFVGPGRP